jgi:hypothetical protein
VRSVDEESRRVRMQLRDTLVAQSS